MKLTVRHKIRTNSKEGRADLRLESWDWDDDGRIATLLPLWRSKEVTSLVRRLDTLIPLVMPQLAVVVAAALAAPQEGGAENERYVMVLTGLKVLFKQ
jgi:hypothetical protein